MPDGRTRVEQHGLLRVEEDEPADDKVEEEDGIHDEQATLLRLRAREEAHGRVRRPAERRRRHDCKQIP